MPGWKNIPDIESEKKYPHGTFVGFKVENGSSVVVATAKSVSELNEKANGEKVIIHHVLRPKKSRNATAEKVVGL